MKIILILFLGFILRLINLNQSLWLDEAISVLAAKTNSFVDIVTKFSLADFHPPLYYLLLKLWTQVFGFSEISVRLPSVLFGVATVYFVYLIGKKIFSQKIGLITALFLAINPLAIYYSQEARMYSLVALAITASFYFFLTKKRLWFLIFFTIALFSDYLPWLLIPVFFALSFTTTLPILLFLVPLFPLLYHQLIFGLQTASANPGWQQILGAFNFKSVALTLVKFIFGRITLDSKILYAAIFGSISLIYLWILSEAKNRLLWLWLTVPIILGTIVSLKVPVFSYFRFLFVLPAFCLLLAEGVKQNIKFTFFIIFISVIALAVFNLNPRFQREDWRGAVSYMEKDSSKAFIPSLAQAPPIYYYHKHLAVNDKDTITIGPGSTVYLIRYVQEIFDQNDFLRKVLELSGYQKVEEKSFNGVVVWKYQYENRN